MHLLKRIELLAVILLLVSCAPSAYTTKDAGKTRVLNYTDEVVYFELADKNVKPEARNEVTYTYFQGDRIATSQGGYDGRLLSGEYKSLYTNKVLKEKGMYKDGVKDGVWKKWNDQGQLLEVITWKEGILNGKLEKYHKGQLANEFRYRNNELVIKDEKPAKEKSTAPVEQDKRTDRKKKTKETAETEPSKKTTEQPAKQSSVTSPTVVPEITDPEPNQPK